MIHQLQTYLCNGQHLVVGMQETELEMCCALYRGICCAHPQEHKTKKSPVHPLYIPQILFDTQPILEREMGWEDDEKRLAMLQ